MPAMFPATTAVIEWKPVSLPDGSTFQVGLTPPNLSTFLEGLYHDSDARLVEIRFRCISGWRGLFQSMPNGGKVEVAFNEENLVTMLRTHRGLVKQLADIVRPLFIPVVENEEKNSVTPSTEAAATSPSQSESTPDTNG